MTPPPNPAFALIIEATRDPRPDARGEGQPAEYRLKLLLKSMLRALGFRCRSVAPHPPPVAPPPPTL